MSKEIERKFLIHKHLFNPTVKGDFIAQGYLSKNPTVRVRIKNDKAFLTIKSKTQGISRSEYEYEIPLPDAQELLKLCEPSIIVKRRYVIDRWEVDIFEGDNDGLIIAEIELDDENESFDKPIWIAEEVSFDERYFNSNLSKFPFKDW